MEQAVKYKIHMAGDLEPGLSADWVYQCAMSLLRYPVDEAISEHLASMGEASYMDRAWMIEYRPDLLRFSNTHEWCRGQTRPFVTELQNVPTTLLAWLHSYLVKKRAVAVHDVYKLPRSARSTRVEFLRQGNKSVLSVPVLHDGKLRGIIGFDTTVKYHVWSPAEVSALYRCADLIGQAKYGKGYFQHKTALSESSSPLIYLSKRGVVRGVPPEAIVGVRSAGNYSEIWLEDGSMVLDSRAFGMWSTLLPEKLFFRVHRTAIVNALHVVDLDRRNVGQWLVRVRAADRSWPVSRPHRRALRERIGI
ncbi:MAG TPA: LytTR family transcriptional regulator DNA-binding domain-containing protein [Bordetella sp.]|nr:LytTR family transcriptional regulator DNA-binding domain-containing protein [Bordetella sp.]